MYKSSTATVPYTVKCLEELGINSKIIKFIIPIGAAINMDGIALYESIGAIFIIQLRGLQFSLLKIIIVRSVKNMKNCDAFFLFEEIFCMI